MSNFRLVFESIQLRDGDKFNLTSREGWRIIAKFLSLPLSYYEYWLIQYQDLTRFVDQKTLWI